MRILKPLQNKLKKRFTVTKCNSILLPRFYILNVDGVSFKTYFLDIPFYGSLELVIQK